MDNRQLAARFITDSKNFCVLQEFQQALGPTMGTARQSGRGLMSSINIHLVPSLGMTGTVPPLPTVWRTDGQLHFYHSALPLR